MNLHAGFSREERLRRLEERIGSNAVLSGESETLAYRRDWHGDVTGEALAVLRPRSTGEVSAAVVACRELGLKIVPQGGNTGLVLGALPGSAEDHVILNLERMNRIRSVDPDDFSAVVEAGCILSSVKEAVAAEGMFFPLSLGAQGSCQVGGNVATNAGGVNVLRYGMTRELVLGLEVVLPDGRVWDGLSTLRKDNRGIDLKQLFIGAEGTLGIVTAVALKLSPLPESRETALIAVGSLEDAVALFRLARRQCCDLMSAFEFMPPAAFALAQEALPHLSMPLAGDHAAYVLMEIAGSGLVDIAGLMQRFLELGMENGLIADGVIASSEAQAANLWLFREGMVEGQAKRGLHLRTDVSVPLSRLADFVRDAERAVMEALPQAFCISYGHVGDGNVHLNVLPPAGSGAEERRALIGQAKKIIDRTVEAYGGSISAEHGIGRLKRPEFEAHMASGHRDLLKAIRRAIDPEALMNPGCQIE
jgi:FAD/FMN-containing dehydrogenase